MAYSSSYHQTNSLTLSQVQTFSAIAGSQDEAVLKFFQANPGEWSPETIQERVLPNAPLTSARRSITNLTEAGQLIKLDKQVTGKFGRPVHLWTLAKKQLEFNFEAD